MDFKRTIKCSNCSNETTVYLNSELEMSELLLAGKCARCGNSLQLSFNIVKSEGDTHQSESEGSSSDVSIDDTLFTPDIPSDTIKYLMEE